MDSLSDIEVLEQLQNIVKECERRSKPVEVLINVKYGGFQLSEEVLSFYSEATGSSKIFIDEVDFRTDPILLDIVKKLGLEKSGAGRGTMLNIVTIDVPLGWKIEIEEYDGIEDVDVYLPLN